MRKWTDDQEKAITTRNCDLLVSAAAGSGKTAVLVERIIRMITAAEGPIDIDRLLVVTFTKAAAAQMLQEIRQRLEAMIPSGADPLAQARVGRQLALLGKAHISTIDSFCSQVVQDNYYLLGIDPCFTIADDSQLKLLQVQVMDQLMAAAYAGTLALDAANFEALTSMYVSGKDDQALRDIITGIYVTAQSYPDPDRWIAGLLKPWSMAGLEGQGWMPMLNSHVQAMTQGALDSLRQALEDARQPYGPRDYVATLAQDIAYVQAIHDAKGFAAMQKAFAGRDDWPKMPRKSKDVDEDLHQQAKGLRDRAKKMIVKMRQSYFAADSRQVIEQMHRLAGPMDALIGLVRAYAQQYGAAKMRRQLADFSDVEHWALSILTRPSDGYDSWDENKDMDIPIEPTAAARRYQQVFEEILIDEYQDSNLVQDFLLRAVSREKQGRPNIFMVGDVKQSIYRFRLARPELFMAKYRNYREGNDQRYSVVTLSRNFRSRKEQVLDPVNDIFRHVMTAGIGSITYAAHRSDTSNTLNYGASYPPIAYKDDAMELLLVDCGADLPDDSQQGPDDDDRDSQQLEATAVALRIRQLLDPVTGMKVSAGPDGMRPAQYGDVMVLLRTMAGRWSDVFVQTLGDFGIPAYADTQTGYFGAAEVSTVLSLLAVLDNPHQDIPLAAVLRSPIGGLDNQQLADLRLDHGTGDMYDCLTASTMDAAQPIKELLASFRPRAALLPPSRLIAALLDATGYLMYVRAMDDGKRRYANLQMLMQKAAEFEALGYRGLSDFNRYISQLRDYDIDYGEAASDVQEGRMVRITSIHKSKGLQAPIVIVAGTAKAFNKSDAQARMVLHQRLGLGPNVFGPHLKQGEPTLAKSALGLAISIDSLGEEIRILYVALTRAKEKLVVTGVTGTGRSRSLAKRLAELLPLRLRHAESVPYDYLAGANSELDIIMMGLADHPALDGLFGSRGIAAPAGQDMDEAVITARAIDPSELPVAPRRQVETPDMKRGRLKAMIAAVEPEASVAGRIDAALRFEYPYHDDQGLPAKLTVSELKQAAMHDETDTQPTALFDPDDGFTPIGQLTASQLGTAYHSIMQRIDFADPSSVEGVAAAMGRQGYLTAAQLEAIDLGRIKAFIASPLGRRMARAEVHREQPFVMTMAASRLPGHQASGATVLVQGVIDAYFEQDGQLTVLDYKTDRGVDADTLAKRYQVQLDCYAQALEQLTGRPVAEEWIYSFTLGQAIPLHSRR